MKTRVRMARCEVTNSIYFFVEVRRWFVWCNATYLRRATREQAEQDEADFRKIVEELKQQ